MVIIIDVEVSVRGATLAKIISRVRGFITRLLLRLSYRAGMEKTVQRIIAESPHLAQGTLVGWLGKASDKDLNQMIKDIDEANFDSESLRMLEAFKAAGVDIVQKVRDEKFLRDHRRKYKEVRHG